MAAKGRLPKYECRLGTHCSYQGKVQHLRGMSSQPTFGAPCNELSHFPFADDFSIKLPIMLLGPDAPPPESRAGGVPHEVWK